MKRATLTHHIDALITETEMLLRFQFAYNRIYKLDDLKTISRSGFVDRLISLKAIENDLVLRICKFSDHTKGVHSFPKALLEIKTSHSNKVEIIKNVELFEKLIGKLKKERRHNQLAHLKIGTTDNEYETKYNLVPAISMIVNIIDLMNINKVGYKWSDGRYEKFNLRHEVLHDKS